MCRICTLIRQIKDCDGSRGYINGMESSKQFDQISKYDAW